MEGAACTRGQREAGLLAGLRGALVGQEKGLQLLGCSASARWGLKASHGVPRFRPLGLCRADALPACEQGLFSLHALRLRFYEELPSVGALGIFIPGLRSTRLTVGLGNVPAV